MEKTRIFISYRREDTAPYAGRIYDRLVTEFGFEQVFFDIDTIPPGDDFVEVLSEKVESCDILLAVIGKSWLTIADAAGRPRIKNPEDFVAIEIGAALRRKVRVIPVLVGGRVGVYGFAICRRSKGSLVFQGHPHLSSRVSKSAKNV